MMDDNSNSNMLAVMFCTAVMLILVLRITDLYKVIG
jgi:hypothetical protein